VALDAWIASQNAPLTRPEAIRAMMETILHILSKDPGEKPRLSDLEAKLEQFAMNVRRAPEWVRTAHLTNELA